MYVYNYSKIFEKNHKNIKKIEPTLDIMDDILLLVLWFSTKRETKRDADNIMFFNY